MNRDRSDAGSLPLSRKLELRMAYSLDSTLQNLITALARLVSPSSVRVK